MGPRLRRAGWARERARRRDRPGPGPVRTNADEHKRASMIHLAFFGCVCLFIVF